MILSENVRIYIGSYKKRGVFEKYNVSINISTKNSFYRSTNIEKVRLAIESSILDSFCFLKKDGFSKNMCSAIDMSKNLFIFNFVCLER